MNDRGHNAVVLVPDDISHRRDLSPRNIGRLIQDLGGRHGSQRHRFRQRLLPHLIAQKFGRAHIDRAPCNCANHLRQGEQRHDAVSLGVELNEQIEIGRASCRERV